MSPFSESFESHLAKEIFIYLGLPLLVLTLACVISIIFFFVCVSLFVHFEAHCCIVVSLCEGVYAFVRVLLSVVR